MNDLVPSSVSDIYWRSCNLLHVVERRKIPDSHGYYHQSAIATSLVKALHSFVKNYFLPSASTATSYPVLQ